MRRYPSFGIVCVALACMLLGFVFPQTAISQDGTPDSGETVKKAVLMATPGQRDQVDSIVESVGAQLVDLPIIFEVSWIEGLENETQLQEATAKKVAGETGARVVFWCDLTVARRVYFYVDMPDGGIVLVRRLEDSPSSVVAESLAVIVRSRIKSILRGEEIEVFVEEQNEPDKEKEEEPASKEDKAPPPREKILSLETAYAIEVQSSRSIAQGIAVGIDLRIARMWNIFARYVLLIPIDKRKELEGFKLDIERHPVWLGARFKGELGNIVTLSGGLAIRFDFLTMDIRESPSGYSINDDPSIEVSVAPVIQMGVRIVGPARLLLAIGANIPIYYVKWSVPVAQTGTDEEAKKYVINNWPVRPFGLVGLSVDLF
ncbi:MAG: hypothetical protein GY854_31695 [Deltaproteobacteria bacterium]|nr:hypothetical protein [Deltaproteobacteria bacterium]